jgi:hypothetical protein
MSEAILTVTPVGTKNGLLYFFKYEDEDTIEIGYCEFGTEVSELTDRLRARAKRKGFYFNIRNEKITGQASFDASFEPELPPQ